MTDRVQLKLRGHGHGNCVERHVKRGGADAAQIDREEPFGLDRNRVGSIRHSDERYFHVRLVRHVLQGQLQMKVTPPKQGFASTEQRLAHALLSLDLVARGTKHSQRQLHMLKSIKFRVLTIKNNNNLSK